MKLQPILTCGLLFGSIDLLMAQIKKVDIRTTGISCGVCAAVSELNFKRMPGIDQVMISRSKEAILLSYKPGSSFRPQQIWEVLQPLGIGIVEFHITARGHMEEHGGKCLFIAGNSKFVLAPAGNTPTVPADTPVLIEAALNDRVDPAEVKILNFKLLK